MSSNLLKVRKPQQDGLYTCKEMEILNKYKEEYCTQTTRELRANVIHTKILADLFNHWVDIGKAPKNEDEHVDCMKVF